MGLALAGVAVAGKAELEGNGHANWVGPRPGEAKDQGGRVRRGEPGDEKKGGPDDPGRGQGGHRPRPEHRECVEPSGQSRVLGGEVSLDHLQVIVIVIVIGMGGVAGHGQHQPVMFMSAHTVLVGGTTTQP